MLPFYWLFIYAAFDGLSQIQIVVKVTSGMLHVDRHRLRLRDDKGRFSRT